MGAGAEAKQQNGTVPESSLDSVPHVIGKYRLLAELGQGGMARVFLAVSQGPAGFSKLVVLKIIRVQLAEDPETIEMFMDEARLAGRLNHPNVVQTYEVGEIEGRSMLVMEYLDGQSLAAVLRRAERRQKAFPLAMHLRVLTDVLSGLHYAHELKDFDGQSLELVHRDVSPQNMFVTYEGQVKMLDFGIAKAGTSSSETRAGIIKGKIAYMAPEQFLGEPIDRRVDIYAMGAVLWQAATGVRLWKGLPDGQMIHRVLAGDIPPPSSVCSDVPPSLERVVMKALARQPEKRHASAAELQAELEEVLEELHAKVLARDLGGYVSELFADVRTQIAQTIEKRLAKASAPRVEEFSPDSVPYLSAGTSTSLSLPVIPASGRTGMLTVNTSLRLSRKVLESAIASVENDPSSLSSPSGAQVGPLYSSVPAEPLPVASKRRLWLPLAGLLLAAAGLTGGYFLSPSLRAVLGQRPSSPPPAVSVPQEQASQPALSSPSALPSQASPPPPAEIEVRLEASPPQARLFWDDQELSANPAVHRAVRDGAVHRLRVEAPGFESRLLEVVADKDSTVTVALTPQSPHPGAASGGKARGERSAGKTEGTKAAPAKSARALDKDNPWAQ